MIEITVPRLGWSMEEGTFSEWLKRDGDWVDIGEMLFVLESDKAAQEVESFEAGVLRIPAAPKPGDTVRVGQVIGYLVAREEEAAFELPRGEPPAATIAAPPPSDEAPVPPADQFTRATGGVASPRARRAAKQRGVDWQSLTGTGRDGRIRERDVLAAPASASISATRRTIADRMAASARSTAPVTLTTKLDAGNLVNLRGQFKATAAGEAVPGITDIIVKLAAIALQKQPELNSRWQDDGIVRLDQVNIGVAVDAPAGLLVPVIRDVPKLGLKQVAALTRSLVAKARERRLSADDLRGGTFTVTNLGMYGVDAFTPIINAPEAAILGVGSVRREAVVFDDERIAAGRALTLSLTFDHRIVDGAPAARFLQTLRTLIENPAAWLAQ